MMAPATRTTLARMLVVVACAAAGAVGGSAIAQGGNSSPGHPAIYLDTRDQTMVLQPGETKAEEETCPNSAFPLAAGISPGSGHPVGDWPNSKTSWKFKVWNLIDGQAIVQMRMVCWRASGLKIDSKVK